MPFACLFLVLRACLLLVLALALPLAQVQAQAQVAKPAKRVALLIGNAEYKHERALNNPVADADLLGRVLKRELGFDLVEVKHNLSASDMRNALVRFANQAKGAETVLFYFSGHGIRAERRNFLLATEAHINITPQGEWELLGLPADEVRDKLKAVGARITLLLLDACRNGPGDEKSGNKGLIKIGGGEGLLIGYAAAEDQTAQDGTGANSPYASALARALRRNDLSLLGQLDQVARDVASEVAKAGRKQKPTREGDLPIDEYLRPEHKPAVVKLQAQEEAGWQVCINGKTAQPCLDYEREFPNGARIKAVRARIADFQRVVATPVPTPTVVAKPPGAVGLQAGQVVKDCDVCPELVLIPGGVFVMGDDKSVFRDEEPAHRVTVSSFLLGKFEVTQGQWRAVMGSNPSHFKGCGDNCPVEQVSWEDVQAYLKKLSVKAGYTYRLPTEAEWEYTARAGSQTNWHFGDDEAQLGRYAWYGEGLSGKTYTVGGKQANPFGLHDMHGNVWEWVEDCYRGNYRGAPKNGSAWQENCRKEKSRVLRGGSWYFDAIDARAAGRNRGEPTSRNNNIGVRVARTLH